MQTSGKSQTPVVIKELKVLMVALVQSNWNLILAELSWWKKLARGAEVLHYTTVSY